MLHPSHAHVPRSLKVSWLLQSIHKIWILCGATRTQHIRGGVGKIVSAYVDSTVSEYTYIESFMRALATTTRAHCTLSHAVRVLFVPYPLPHSSFSFPHHHFHTHTYIHRAHTSPRTFELGNSNVTLFDLPSSLCTNSTFVFCDLRFTPHRPDSILDPPPRSPTTNTHTHSTQDFSLPNTTSSHTLHASPLPLW